MKKLYPILFRFVFLSTLLVPRATHAQEGREYMEAPMKVGEEERSEAEVYQVVDVMPQFPGGQEALYNYVAATLEYPEKAVKAGVSGTVFVSFVVGTDGAIYDPQVLRGIGADCDEEALRVVSAMPNWEPGTQRGEPVRVRYNLPIRFKL